MLKRAWIVGSVPHGASLFAEGSQLQLHTVYAVDTIDEEDEDKDECDL